MRLVAGVETAAIARAFLVPEATMAQRLVRAKRKIRSANIPFRMPDESHLPERVGSVLKIIFLTYNEGYIATSGDGLDRPDLCAEAIHLGRLMVRLMPDEPEIRGLLALMLFITARRPSRIAPDGSLVLLAEQDRDVHGPIAALDAIDDLDLAQYAHWHAIRADLLRRCGRTLEAADEYDRAIEATDNPVERQHLRRRRRELPPLSEADDAASDSGRC